VISFEEPIMVFFFLPLAGLAIVSFFWRGRGGRLQFSLGSWKGTDFAYSPRWLKTIMVLRTLSFYLGLSLIILALAGPAFLRREQVFLNQGTNFMVVLDISPSMKGDDFAPETRLDSALRVIRQFLETREKDPIGLVTFASTATLRVPPTLDYGFFYKQLSQLDIDSGPHTAIGMGIALGALHLQSAPKGQRIMILLSDGSNNFGEILPQTAAEMAKALGIRIHTIGIGTDRKVNVEYVDPITGRPIFAEQENVLDEMVLTRVAQSTGGKYYPARSMGSLETVFRSIDSRESQEKKVRQEVKSYPIHQEILYAALALFILVYLINKLILREVF
jgi:Ca-activated chloride channel family protein